MSRTAMRRAIYIDSFDHDSNEPPRLKGADLDIHVLSTATRVSCFWMSLSDARAKRVDAWIRSGVLVTDNTGHVYPWVGIKSFAKERA